MLPEFVSKKSRPLVGALPCAVALVSVLTGLTMVGCGGGSSTGTPLTNQSPNPIASPTPSPSPSTGPRDTDPVPTVTRAKFSIDWPGRSRPGNTRVVPSSAVSVVVVFPESASISGKDQVRVVVNRDSEQAAAYTSSYTAGTDMLTGNYRILITAYAEPDGKGSIVGTATVSAQIVADGTGLGSLSTNGKVAATYVTDTETLIVGDKRLLQFSASDAEGKVLLLTPGSAFFNVISGGDLIRVTGDQEVEALKPGMATIRVTIDGIPSEPKSVQIVSNAGITVTPAVITLATNDRRKFTATVVDAPDSRVIWTLDQGEAGGKIDADGNYTSPSTPGTYGVTATSVYDPTKSFTAIVNVASDDETVPVDPDLNGDLPIIVK